MTLREHLEAIRDRHPSCQVFRDVFPIPASDPPWCCCCDEAWPCPDYRDAVAALAILDESERERNESRDPSNRYPLDRVLVDDPPVSS